MGFLASRPIGSSVTILYLSFCHAHTRIYIEPLALHRQEAMPENRRHSIKNEAPMEPHLKQYVTAFLASNALLRS